MYIYTYTYILYIHVYINNFDECQLSEGRAGTFQKLSQRYDFRFLHLINVVSLTALPFFFSSFFSFSLSGRCSKGYLSFIILYHTRIFTSKIDNGYDVIQRYNKNLIRELAQLQLYTIYSLQATAAHDIQLAQLQLYTIYSLHSYSCTRYTACTATAAHDIQLAQLQLHTIYNLHSYSCARYTACIATAAHDIQLVRLQLRTIYSLHSYSCIRYTACTATAVHDIQLVQLKLYTIYSLHSYSCTRYTACTAAAAHDIQLVQLQLYTIYSLFRYSCTRYTACKPQMYTIYSLHSYSCTRYKITVTTQLMIFKMQLGLFSCTLNTAWLEVRPVRLKDAHSESGMKAVAPSLCTPLTACWQADTLQDTAVWTGDL